jgi:hypothetical protein
MSGLPIVNENLKVSVGAARRGVDSAERRAAGKGARQRGEADPLPASTVRRYAPHDGRRSGNFSVGEL